MSPAEQYRKLAAELISKAGTERNSDVASELTALARSYLRLAEQAEQNRGTDLWFEFGSKPALDRRDS